MRVCLFGLFGGGRTGALAFLALAARHAAAPLVRPLFGAPRARPARDGRTRSGNGPVAALRCGASLGSLSSAKRCVCACAHAYVCAACGVVRFATGVRHARTHRNRHLHACVPPRPAVLRRVWPFIPFRQAALPPVACCTPAKAGRGRRVPCWLGGLTAAGCRRLQAVERALWGVQGRSLSVRHGRPP